MITTTRKNGVQFHLALVQPAYPYSIPENSLTLLLLNLIPNRKWSSALPKKRDLNSSDFFDLWEKKNSIIFYLPPQLFSYRAIADKTDDGDQDIIYPERYPFKLGKVFVRRPEAIVETIQVFDLKAMIIWQ